MKAVICTGYGPPEVLKVSEVPKPVPKPDEILVRIHSAAVNSGDIRTRSLDVKGALKIGMRLALGWKKPRNPILGNVFSGTVEQLGEAVTTFKPGDRVYGCTQGIHFGCYAEYTTIKESAPVTIMPAKASFDEAVALLFGGTTALYFLEKAGATSGQSIMIYGASGAVGSSAVQAARNMGLVVTAVSSVRNEDLIRSLGADTFLDYTSYDFWKGTTQYDIVFDAVGKLDSKQLESLTRKDGKSVTVGGLDVAKETKQQLAQLKDWFDSGELHPVIDRTYPMDQIREAHVYVEKGHKRGNVVIEVTPSQEDA
jgi:NADPH:quinone reductase-like Zn-dependent oxidoreductase